MGHPNSGADAYRYAVVNQASRSSFAAARRFHISAFTFFIGFVKLCLSIFQMKNSEADTRVRFARRHWREGCARPEFRMRWRAPSLPRASSPDFLEHLTSFLNDLCYQKENWQHDAQVRTSDGVHPFVRVWYSPALFDWMTVENRQGPVPNGAIVVKEMYVTLTAPLTEWTVMVKDSNLSWDGWYWGDLVNPSPKDPNAPPEPARRVRRAAGAPQRNGTLLS